MTNCNKPTFPSICTNADFSEPFHNTGELIYYQKIDPVHASHVDGVVILERNGNYYKAIYTENTINIEWYRCRYKNDDEAMITQAIKTAAYLGATLRFDAREYIVNKQLDFQGLSCFKLLGDRQHTWIKSDSKRRFESFYFSFTECNNFIIEGIQFDLNKRNIPEVYSSADDALSKEFNGGILIKGDPQAYLSYNIEITNCHFHDLYNRAIRIYGCSQGHIIVRDNLFESGVQEQIYMMEHLVISQSHSANVTVENNVFRNAENHDPSKAPCAIFAFDLGYHGSVLINNNYFDYCGRNNTGHHRLYAIDFYDNVNNFIISNNVFRNTTWGAIRFDGTKKNAVICDNVIHQIISEKGDGGMITAAAKATEGFDKIFKNITISNNIFEAVAKESYGINLQSSVDDIIADNISIQNNNFDNLRTTVIMSGTITNVNICNNIGLNIQFRAIEYIAHSIKTTVLADGTVIKTNTLNAPLGNVLIKGNNFRLDDADCAIFLEGFTPALATDYDAVRNLTRRFVISDNLIYGSGIGYGITINHQASLDGKVTISGNEISNFNTGLYLRCKKIIAKENILFDCITIAINDDGITDHIKLNNYYNNTPI
ncbi:right-handed parallel beta-helix repeat-containing protein [Chryseobacterium lactis]|uniref:right-handed parallel beta-helix repeat-containing protein n=1 Tax=Chryseobacterium lactis TaxID=1241981 RepID=UPI001628D753|nr:right-handed parallel beta-helix repeat-containing protein [Chryseobacterium lactis]